MSKAKFVTFVVLAVVLCCGQTYSQVRLRPEDADRLVIEKPEPDYPAIARMLKLQDTVSVDVTVSESGSVIGAKVLNGNAALKSAAIDAVRKRRYKPHVINDKPTPFITTVQIVFSLGIPKDEYERDRRIGEQYFKQENNCRSLVREEKWNLAEGVCNDAVRLAEMFGSGRELEKMGAYELAGHVMRGQKRYREALDFYNRARDVVHSKLDEKDAELGRLYGDIAIAYHLLRNLDRAREFYRHAERVLQAAYENMGRDNVDDEIEEIRRGYIKSLRRLLQYHLMAAEDAGATSEIDDIKKLMKSLP